MVSPNRTKMLRSNSAPVVGGRGCAVKLPLDRRAACEKAALQRGASETTLPGGGDLDLTMGDTSPRHGGRAILGVLGQDLGLQMDLAAVDRDAADANEESYDFSEGGTLIDWRHGLNIKTLHGGEGLKHGTGAANQGSHTDTHLSHVSDATTLTPSAFSS